MRVQLSLSLFLSQIRLESLWEAAHNVHLMDCNSAFGSASNQHKTSYTKHTLLLPLSHTHTHIHCYTHSLLGWSVGVFLMSHNPTIIENCFDPMQCLLWTICMRRLWPPFFSCLPSLCFFLFSLLLSCCRPCTPSSAIDARNYQFLAIKWKREQVGAIIQPRGEKGEREGVKECWPLAL